MDTNINIKIDENSIKLYKYRWVILILYSLYSAVNFFQFQELTIISDVVEVYYQVSKTQVNLTGLIFMIVFILFFVPIGYLTDKTNLYFISLFGIGLTTLGNVLKLFALEPGDFYLILIAQALIGIAEISMLITPSKIASTWFGPEEVSLACAINVFGSQAGVALGCVIPAVMVKKHHKRDVTREHFKSLYMYNVIISVIITLLIAIFFRSEPQLPPSPSQLDLKQTSKKEVDETRITYWGALKSFCKNRDFLLVQLAFSIPYGLWNSFGILINQMYLNYFPDDTEGNIGVFTGLAAFFGGCFGTLFYGFLLDKTHNFKKISILALFACAFVTFIELVSFMLKNKFASDCMIVIGGFFQASLMVVAFEYSTETTFPIPEEFGCAICNVCIYISAIFYVVVLRIFFDNVSYLAGNIVIIVSMMLSVFVIYFVSPELRRRNANLQSTEEKIRY